MNKNKFSIVLVLIVVGATLIYLIPSIISTSNSFEYNWSRTWGGDQSDAGYEVAVDSSDNIYLAGWTYSYGLGYQSMALLKYDDSGSLLWNITWGGSGYDSCYGVVVDSLDNVYIVGYTGSFGAGGDDMVIVKYNSIGLQQWNRTWGGSAILKAETAWGVAVDSLNNVYIAGYTENFGVGEEDLVLLKYDDSGVQIWNRTWGGGLSERGYSVVVDTFNNIYVSGSTFSFGAGDEDILLVKYDHSGKQLWNRTWGGGLSDSGSEVAVDSFNNVYISGTTESFGAGNEDMVLIKFDGSGNQLWNRTWGGASFDSGSDVVIDSMGNVYSVGSSKSHTIHPDILIVKYNSSGAQLWSQTWGGSDVDLCFGGAVDSSDNLYLGGVTGDDMILVRFGIKQQEETSPGIPGYSMWLLIGMIGVVGILITYIVKKKSKYFYYIVV
ncbi:MAG: SBBP repeat-containing protein [Candidatus Hodarchaeota archaeon]